jgi:transcriptional regulator with XRE-family HTH domain
VIRISNLGVIPAFIGDMRVLNRLRQRELAVQSGHSQGQVSSWELGNVVPTVQALIDVARALGYDLALIPTEEPAAGPAPMRRLRPCVEAWPGAETGAYDPRCCRFPKSCSATVYDPERVDEADLEPALIPMEDA